MSGGYVAPKTPQSSRSLRSAPGSGGGDNGDKGKRPGGSGNRSKAGTARTKIVKKPAWLRVYETIAYLLDRTIDRLLACNIANILARLYKDDPDLPEFLIDVARDTINACTH
ncbi:hypothetical protein E8E13_000193 [Curvularia kusanoi]|uniref:Uncharacterized protein n=1 Tax=Curvularia kusanoi TaxID=90978 RepID=A0A9P4TB91_CURKU|nr:hypothetical protein E8E13_000193 [Curvularia kusanoi]